MALVAGAALATLAVFGRWADDEDLATSTLLQWRFALGAAALAAAGYLRASVPARTRLLLVAAGGIYTVQTSFYFAGLARISAGTTALLLYLSPAFVILYGRLLGRRTPAQQAVAVVVALAGLVVILGVPSSADASLSGVLFAAAAGATFAGYALLVEIAFADVSPIVVAAHSMVGAAIGFVVVDLVDGGFPVLPSSGPQWALVFGIAVVPTILAIPLLFGAIGRIGAGPTAVIATSEPAFTVLYAAVLLDEPPRPTQLIGGALILVAALLAQRSPHS